MPLLYATDLQLEAGASTVVPFEAARKHVARWVSFEPSRPISENDLASSGQIELRARTHRGQHFPGRTLRWEAVSVTDARGLRMVVTQIVAESDVELRTTVTLCEVAGTCTLRVAFEREQRGVWLSPVDDTAVYQPRIVRELASDESLVLRVSGQVVDGRYIPILNAPEATTLADLLGEEHRLPMLIVHARNDVSREIGRVLPSLVVGMTRVVTVNRVALQSLAAISSRVDVPYGGAQLVWSDVRAESVRYEVGRLALLGVDGLRGDLMRRLAPLTALARPTDAGWLAVRRAVQSENQRVAASRVEEARAQDNLTEENAALRFQVDQVRQEADVWRELAETAEERAIANSDSAARVELSEGEARYWRELYEGTQRAVTPEIDLWASVPALGSGADPIDVFEALETATDGRIVFTARAAASWKAIDYPDPEDMMGKLISLARAADALYDSEQELTMGHFDTWIHDEFGLRVALTDQAISNSKALRYFEFEDVRYDQTPHVKVRDGVKPNEVGRIHFAFDKANGRLIVNHVAVKLYTK